jgi:hypothetical protein
MFCCLRKYFKYYVITILTISTIWLFDFRNVPTVWYFRNVPKVWYFKNVPTVWYFRNVPTVWYFRNVPTVWYFRNVPTVWYFRNVPMVFFVPFYCSLVVSILIKHHLGLLGLFRTCNLSGILQTWGTYVDFSYGDSRVNSTTIIRSRSRRPLISQESDNTFYHPSVPDSVQIKDNEFVFDEAHPPHKGTR